MGTIDLMPSGKEGPATGFAGQFAEYLRGQAYDRGWTVEYIASALEMSKNYTAKRLRGEASFNLRDFEKIAMMMDLSPAELSLRVSFDVVSSYEGRLVPVYGVRIDMSGIHVYRTVDADPPMAPPGFAAEDVSVGGVAQDDESETPAEYGKYGLAAHPATEETGEEEHD